MGTKWERYFVVKNTTEFKVKSTGLLYSICYCM